MIQKDESRSHSSSGTPPSRAVRFRPEYHRSIPVLSLSGKAVLVKRLVVNCSEGENEVANEVGCKHVIGLREFKSKQPSSLRTRLPCA
jgi:hypothetical protein